jgi:hypothetical protein
VGVGFGAAEHAHNKNPTTQINKIFFIYLNNNVPEYTNR